MQIIKRHLDDLTENTAMTETTFARIVRENYEARYPVHARTIDWSQHPDASKQMEVDWQHVMRWFSKSSNARLPAEIYDAVVLAFPADRRNALELDLAQARGGIFVHLPEVKGSGDVAAMGRMAKEVSEAIAAVGVLCEDDLIDERDKDKGDWVIDQIHQAMAALLEMSGNIERKVYGREPQSPSNVLLLASAKR